MVRLGEASYSLYIFQYPVWLAVGALAVAVGPWVELSSPRVLFAVFLPVMIGVSLLSHRYVESPLRAWVRSALQPGVERSQRGAAAVSSGTPQA
jgi:peptidoglycan/LPS O-acetylase OafA/YrhL